MLCAIHQPQYMPWLGYFDKMARADVFVLLDNVQFKKNEWQNRNRIRTSQGVQWMTVPVLHDHGQMINEVKINRSVDWREQHQKAVDLNYARAPFYDDYWPRIARIYQTDWEILSDLNIALVRLLAELLGIPTRIVLASELPVTTEKTQRLIDICRAVECDGYLAGVGCSKYMDFELFQSSGIRMDLQDYRHPAYPQLWTKKGCEFQPYLSVIDLLLNCGPRSREIIRGGVGALTVVRFPADLSGQ